MATLLFWSIGVFSLSIARSDALPEGRRSEHPGVAEPSHPQLAAAELKQEAVAVAGQVAGAYPTEALTYALLGSAFYNTGRSQEATTNLLKCLELSPNQADAYEILARVTYDKGEIEEAVRLCQEALKRGLMTPDLLNRLGRALLDLGRAEEAVQTLEKAASLPKPTSESFYLLGQAKMQFGDLPGAKEAFRQAVKVLPDHTQAFFGLFTVSVRLGQTDEAQKYREQFLKLEATDRQDLTDRSGQADTLTGLPFVRSTVARTLFGAAQIYRAHEEFTKAAELLRRSAVLDDENSMYRSALESIYLQRKQLGEGLKAFEQLVTEQPKNGLNHMFLGRFQGRLEQADAAERSFLRVQELAPQWAEGYRALSDLYLRGNRKLAEAQRLARKVVELEPSASHHFLLAVASWKNQDRPSALAAAKQAAALSPGEPKYQQLLQQLQPAP